MKDIFFKRWNFSLNGLIAWVAVQKGARPTIVVTCAKFGNVYYRKATTPVATARRCVPAVYWVSWPRMRQRYLII